MNGNCLVGLCVGSPALCRGRHVPIEHEGTAVEIGLALSLNLYFEEVGNIQPLPYYLVIMSEQLWQELMEALCQHPIVMAGQPGSERPAILIPAELMEVPRGRLRQVRPVYGAIVRTWYLQAHNQLRWAFAEEEAGSSRWLLFHLWSEGEHRWLDCLRFRMLRQPWRGHRLPALHGRRVLVSYSQGLEGQLILVVEEGDDVVWWVFYLAGPENQILHLTTIQMAMAPIVMEEPVVSAPGAKV